MSAAFVRAGASCLLLAAAASYACATTGSRPAAAAAPAQPRPAQDAAPPRLATPRAASHAQAPIHVAPTSAVTDGRVTVELLGLENARGQVLVALFRSARGFPDRGAGAFGSQVREARAGTLMVTFDSVPPGPFAVSAHHDEDGDFAMDTGLFGIPSEGYGFSRDARGSFGPPDFAAASLTLAAGQHQRVPIHMNY
jgi:uncharacterized protein (DUF2141 family)